MWRQHFARLLLLPRMYDMYVRRLLSATVTSLSDFNRPNVVHLTTQKFYERLVVSRVPPTETRSQ